MCSKQAQASLTYERETYKRKYKFLDSEYAMHLYGLRSFTSIQKWVQERSNPLVSASLSKRNQALPYISS